MGRDLETSLYPFYFISEVRTFDFAESSFCGEIYRSNYRESLEG